MVQKIAVFCSIISKTWRLFESKL